MLSLRERHIATPAPVADPDILLSAVLYAEGVPATVTIRDLSPTGAMIEGAALPEPGTIFQLVRGTLIVHGLVAWTGSRRCGLQFSGTVDVSQWRYYTTHVEQQRVDEIVRVVKAGAVPLPVAPRGERSEPDDRAISRQELPEDLRRVAGLLDQLGDSLAADPLVIERHGTALQNLDIAAQVIAAVREVVTGLSSTDIDPTKLTGLRRSADQALLRRA